MIAATGLLAALIAIALFCPAYAMPQLTMLRRIAGAVGLAMAFVIGAYALIKTQDAHEASEGIAWGMFAVSCAVAAVALRPTSADTAARPGSSGQPGNSATSSPGATPAVFHFQPQGQGQSQAQPGQGQPGQAPGQPLAHPGQGQPQAYPGQGQPSQGQPGQPHYGSPTPAGGPAFGQAAPTSAPPHPQQ